MKEGTEKPILWWGYQDVGEDPCLQKLIAGYRCSLQGSLKSLACESQTPGPMAVLDLDLLYIQVSAMAYFLFLLLWFDLVCNYCSSLMSLNRYLNEVVFIEEFIPWNGSFLHIATPVGDAFLKRHATCFKNSVFLSMKDCQLPRGNLKTQLFVYLTTSSSGHSLVLANFSVWCQLMVSWQPVLLCK